MQQILHKSSAMSGVQNNRRITMPEWLVEALKTIDLSEEAKKRVVDAVNKVEEKYKR